MVFCKGDSCTISGHRQCMTLPEFLASGLCGCCLERRNLNLLVPSPPDVNPSSTESPSSRSLSSVLTDTEIAAMKFWIDCPEIWFAETEAFFARKDIHDDSLKYDYVLKSIEWPIPENEIGLGAAPATHKYDYAKKEMLELCAIRNEELFGNDLIWDRRNLLTEGCVRRLLSGEWNGESFIVQVIEVPPDREDLPSGQMEFVFVVITDGKDKSPVKISREWLSLIKIPGSESIDCHSEDSASGGLDSKIGDFDGILEDLSIIKVEECRYNLIPKTKLLQDFPCKIWHACWSNPYTLHEHNYIKI